MYVSGRVDIFDMVDIDLFTVVALNMMVLKLGYIGESELMFYNYLRLLTSLDVGLYALACDEDVRCLATLVRSFKLIEPTDESVITYTQLSGAHRFDTQSHVLPTIQSQFSDINLNFVSQQATASQVIDDVMRQLSFDETKLDGEAGFADVSRSGVDSSGLSHDESFKVDDLDVNLNEPVNLNVSQVETQSKLAVSEEPDLGLTQEPILVEVSTQEPIVAEVNTQEPIVAEVSTETPIVEEVRTQEFSVKDVVIKDYSSEDAGIDDDDVDEDFLVDEENEIVKPDVDVHLFSIIMDLPFDNIGITNLVPDDVLEGDDVDVINADGFDSDPGNDEERNYRKRMLAELRTEMEGAINDSGQRNLKLYRNDRIRIRARCEGKVHVFTMSQGTEPTGPYSGMEAGPSGSSGPTTRSKKRKNTGTNDDSQASPSFLDAHDKGDLCPWVLVNPDIPVKAVQDQLLRELEVQISMSKAFRAKAKAEKEIRGDHCLGDDIDLHLNSNFTSISDRQKVFNGIIVGGMDTLVIVLLEYIRKYCMKRIMNVQGVIDKCTGPLTHTATRIIDSIKKEAHLMKELTGIPCKHVVVACWNMDLNDRAAPPPETWVGQPKKKRKMSKHKDEPFVKDGKLSRKERTITCQSYRNIRHNKATCKGQGRKVTIGGNNAEGSASASRQAQQTKPAVGQDGLGGSGAGAVIGLSAAAGEGGAGDPGGVGVASQGSSHTRWTRRRVQTERISPQKRTPTQPVSQPSTNSQVPVSQTKNGDRRELGDGVPTQSSAAGGASEWSFL
nr:hypothetical protein [Tanacetum cinerariifolium]